MDRTRSKLEKGEVAAACNIPGMLGHAKIIRIQCLIFMFKDNYLTLRCVQRDFCTVVACAEVLPFDVGDIQKRRKLLGGAWPGGVS